MEEVILVNERDEEVGTMEKMEAHRKGIMHRAFSVFIFNNKNEMLLQQRALQKYHSGGLWTNACCSHPKLGEITEDAAVRRLKEELGFETSLEKVFEFSYKASFDNGLTENEYDHVFVGYHNGEINFDPHEVKDVCFRSMKEIESNLETHPSKFTAWFAIAFPMIKKWQLESIAAAVA